MDLSIINKELLFQLIHERNLIIVKNISDLTIKDKRKMFSLLRQIPDNNLNFIFPRYFGATVGEFCTIQVIMSESKRKFKEYVQKQCAEMNIGLFDTISVDN